MKLSSHIVVSIFTLSGYNIDSLFTKFQVYNIVVLTIISLLYVSETELTHFV